MSQNVEALLGRIEGPAPFFFLDLGCGPGRDLVTFRSLGPWLATVWRKPGG